VIVVVKENNNIGHYAHTAQSTNVKVQKLHIGKEVTFSIHSKHRTAATLLIKEIRMVSRRKR
jgi:VCBS repeat-containing protein